jgi:hypothetical protein
MATDATHHLEMTCSTHHLGNGFCQTTTFLNIAKKISEWIGKKDFAISWHCCVAIVKH